jgi:hypothetical protein
VVAFLDEEVDVLAVAAGLVGGDLLDEKILGADLELASDAGDGGGEVGGGGLGGVGSDEVSG